MKLDKSKEHCYVLDFDQKLKFR